jgi:hypothetical protein
MAVAHDFTILANPPLQYPISSARVVSTAGNQERSSTAGDGMIISTVGSQGLEAPPPIQVLSE